MAIHGVFNLLWLLGAFVDPGVMGLAGFIAPALHTVLRIQGQAGRIGGVQPQHQPGIGRRLCGVARQRNPQQQRRQRS